MKLLFHQAHAAKTKDAIRAILAHDQIRTLRHPLATHAIIGIMTIGARSTLRALAAPVAILTVGAKKAIATLQGEHAVKAAFAILAPVAPRIILSTLMLTLQARQGPFKASPIARDLHFIRLHNLSISISIDA